MIFIIKTMIYEPIIKCLHCFFVLELGILVSAKVIRLANTLRGEDKEGYRAEYIQLASSYENLR